jgi:hypothetical protein
MKEGKEIDGKVQVRGKVPSDLRREQQTFDLRSSRPVYASAALCYLGYALESASKTPGGIDFVVVA